MSDERRPQRWERAGIWQIGTGSGDRDLTEWFYDWQVAAIGGGEREQGIMLDQIKRGDLILLRHGFEVRAVGEVVSDEEAEFSVDRWGWNLAFARRVRWVRLREPFRYSIRRRVSRVRRELDGCGVWDALLHAEAQGRFEDPLRAPPPDGSQPIDSAVLPAGIGELCNRARDFHARSYAGGTRWRTPSEHEAVAHFVVPLFPRIGMGTATDRTRVEDAEGSKAGRPRNIRRPITVPERAAFFD